MKDFARKYLQVSLCGLNCVLCPMHLGGYCPGCGGGHGNKPCPIMKCSDQHGGVEICSQCAEYPCERYAAPDAFDSFITYQNRRTDLEKAARMGLDVYCRELEEKAEILQKLLTEYNDGRRKSFYCTAVNLLDLQVVKSVMDCLSSAEEPHWTAKEKAACAVSLIEQTAQRKNIELKLRKKPKK